MYLNVYKATMGIIFALIHHTINIYIINCNHSNRLDFMNTAFSVADTLNMDRAVWVCHWVLLKSIHYI